MLEWLLVFDDVRSETPKSKTQHMVMDLGKVLGSLKEGVLFPWLYWLSGRCLLSRSDLFWYGIMLTAHLCTASPSPPVHYFWYVEFCDSPGTIAPSWVTVSLEGTSLWSYKQWDNGCNSLVRAVSCCRVWPITLMSVSFLFAQPAVPLHRRQS